MFGNELRNALTPNDARFSLCRFSTKPLLEAHVNSHFEKNSKLKNEASLKSHQLLKLAKRKRLLRQNSKMQGELPVAFRKFRTHFVASTAPEKKKNKSS